MDGSAARLYHRRMPGGTNAKSVQVFECTCFLNRIGRTSTDVAKCDLVFVADIPHIVFEWTTQTGRREIVRSVPLERRFLRDLGGGRYMYRAPLVDLRP